MGIILYIYFLAAGFFYSDYIFAKKDLYYRIYAGLILGNLILMSGIIPFAFIFGFSYVSHALLIVAAAMPYIVLMIRRKKTGVARPGAVYEKLFFGDKSRLAITGGADHKIMLFVILPITLVIWVLLTNHIMTPTESGGIAAGQSTYGDLAMHMGFITSIAEQGEFPPNYNILSGVKLCYPFLIDSLSSSLYLFGGGLRAAILAPSYIFALMTVWGFYYLAVRMTGRKSSAVLASYLFFIGGGFGFAYFLEGAKADPGNFTKIFTDYYHTPTNYNEMNIRWANPICDMIVPQRTTMAGWAMVLFALERLVSAAKKNSRPTFILLGITAGCMVMIHTHSFLALAVISAVMMVWTLIETGAKERKSVLINWLLYAGIAAVLAVPQLFIWTFNQTGGEGFLRFSFNWVNENDPYLWFWLKNWGITAVFVIPAFVNASRDNKKLLTGGILLFIIAEFILFQPNAYDNNKLFFIVYMLALIVVAEFLVQLYEKLKGVRWRGYFAAIVIFMGVFSGALTIGREYYSGGEYETFSREGIEFADFVKENTEPDALFVTATNHLNPVAVLAGRNIYLGASLYVYFHGLNEDIQAREDKLEALYESTTVGQLRQRAEEIGADYVLVSSYERSDYTINEAAFAGLETVYNSGGYTLYKL